MIWAIGDWLWHNDSQALCQIVDVQPLWGQISDRVAYVTQGHQLPASLLGTVSPQTP